MENLLFNGRRFPCLQSGESGFFVQRRCSGKSGRGHLFGQVCIRIATLFKFIVEGKMGDVRGNPWLDDDLDWDNFLELLSNFTFFPRFRMLFQAPGPVFQAWSRRPAPYRAFRLRLRRLWPIPVLQCFLH